MINLIKSPEYNNINITNQNKTSSIQSYYQNDSSNNRSSAIQQEQRTSQRNNNYSSVSKVGLDNRITGPGNTNGDPYEDGIYDSSNLQNTQTLNVIREIDIDVEAGGFVSNVSNSSTVMFPIIQNRKDDFESNENKYYSSDLQGSFESSNKKQYIKMQIADLYEASQSKQFEVEQTKISGPGQAVHEQIQQNALYQNYNQVLDQQLQNNQSSKQSILPEILKQNNIISKAKIIEEGAQKNNLIRQQAQQLYKSQEIPLLQIREALKSLQYQFPQQQQKYINNIDFSGQITGDSFSIQDKQELLKQQEKYIQNSQQSLQLNEIDKLTFEHSQFQQNSKYSLPGLKMHSNQELWNKNKNIVQKYIISKRFIKSVDHWSPKQRGKTQETDKNQLSKIEIEKIQNLLNLKNEKSNEYNKQLASQQSKVSNVLVDKSMNFRNYSSPQNIITQSRIILNDLLSEQQINQSLQSISLQNKNFIENENLSIALDDLHSEILEEDSKLKKVLIKKLIYDNTKQKQLLSLGCKAYNTIIEKDNQIFTASMFQSIQENRKKNRLKKMKIAPFQFEDPEEIVNRRYPKNRQIDELLIEVNQIKEQNLAKTRKLREQDQLKQLKIQEIQFKMKDETQQILSSQSNRSQFILNKNQMQMFSPLISPESSRQKETKSITTQSQNVKFKLENKMSSKSNTSSQESISINDDTDYKDQNNLKSQIQKQNSRQALQDRNQKISKFEIEQMTTIPEFEIKENDEDSWFEDQNKINFRNQNKIQNHKSGQINAVKLNLLQNQSQTNSQQTEGIKRNETFKEQPKKEQKDEKIKRENSVLSKESLIKKKGKTIQQKNDGIMKPNQQQQKQLIKQQSIKQEQVKIKYIKMGIQNVVNKHPLRREQDRIEIKQNQNLQLIKQEYRVPQSLIMQIFKINVNEKLNELISNSDASPSKNVSRSPSKLKKLSVQEQYQIEEKLIHYHINKFVKKKSNLDQSNSQLNNNIDEIKEIEQIDKIIELKQDQINEAQLIASMALMENCDFDIFEFENIKGYKSIVQLQTQIDEFKNETLNQYIKYLTQGNLTNKIVFDFARNMKKKFGNDLIQIFNLKAQDMIDQMILEIINKITFKDLYSSQGPKIPQKLLNKKQIQGQKYFDLNDSVQQVNFSSKNYIFESLESHSVALPVLQKIQQNNLLLINYKMSQGICQALKEGLKSDQDLVYFLFIDNCGLSDYQNSQILDGALFQKNLRELVLKNCEIGPYSSKFVNQIMLKPYPEQLSELQIIKCHLSQNIQNEIINCLLQNQQTIKSLCLVNMNLSKESLKKLSIYIQHYNVHLKHLDISFNEQASAQNFIPILDVLSYDTSQQHLEDKQKKINHHQLSEAFIESINLAGNTLIDPDHKLLQFKDQDFIDEYKKHVSEKLRQMISLNKQLTHLNLNNTGLTEEIILNLLPEIQQSVSLMAVHLSNNPGINEENISKFAKILTQQDQNTLFKNCPSFEEEQDSSGGMIQEYLSNQNRQKLQVRNIQKEKKIIQQNDLSLENQDEDQEISSESKTKVFVIHRYTGFQKEFPNLFEEWKINIRNDKECWICDRQIYSILFWNQNIGNLKQLKIKNQDQIIKFLKSINPEQFQKINQESSAKLNSSNMSYKYKFDILNPFAHVNRPIIYSEFFNWKGMELMTISEYCFLIDKMKKNSRYDKKSFTDIKNIEFALYQHREKLTFEKDVYDQLIYYRQRFRKVINNNLEFRDPQFINVSYLCMNFINNANQETEYSDFSNYVIPQFLKSGLYRYVIQFKNQLYFHKDVIQFRKESIPFRQFVNVNQDSDNLNIFPILNNWREDNEAKLQQCFEHDMRHIRFDLLEISEEEITQLGKVIESQIENLKHLFKAVLTEANNVQGIDLDTLSIFLINKCRFNTNINNKNLASIFEQILFYVPNQNEDLQKTFGGQGSKDKTQRDMHKDISLLCRKEFIEILLHVAKTEFSNVPIVKAFQNVIQTVNKNTESKESYEEFRNLQLRSVKCQQLLLANQDGLDEVYQKYRDQELLKNKHFPNNLSWNQINKIFMIDSQPNSCNLRTLKKACVMSKQTIERDFENGGQCMLYQYFDFVEFIEIIARVADLQSKGTPQETQLLDQKLEQILGPLLRLSNPNNFMKRHQDKIQNKIGSYIKSQLD